MVDKFWDSLNLYINLSVFWFFYYPEPTSHRLSNLAFFYKRNFPFPLILKKKINQYKFVLLIITRYFNDCIFQGFENSLYGNDPHMELKGSYISFHNYYNVW